MNRISRTAFCCALLFTPAQSATAQSATTQSSYDVKSGGFNREEVKESFFPKEEKGRTPEADKPGENPYSDFAQRELTKPELQEPAEQAPAPDEFEVKPESRATR